MNKFWLSLESSFTLNEDPKDIISDQSAFDALL